MVRLNWFLKVSSIWIDKVKHKNSVDEIELTSGIYLWVWHADKIPPHIGVSLGGHYFSLKSNGKDSNLPVGKVLEILTKKKIPSLLVQCDLQVESIQPFFKDYQSADGIDITCLTPLIHLVFNDNRKITLHVLLDNLFQANKIKSIYAVHLTEDYKGLEEYDREVINQRIKNLKNAKGKKYLPEVC